MQVKQAGRVVLNRRLLIASFTLCCLVFAAPPVLKAALHPQKHNKDYWLWFLTAQRVLRDEPLYPHAAGEAFPYMYPPFAAVCVFAPLASWGPIVFTVVLVTVNSVAWIASLLLTTRHMAGRAFGAHPLVYAVPFLITAPYVWDTFFLGQPNLVLLAIVLCGLLSLDSRKDILAGVCFGLCIAIKVFPVFLLPYLAHRRAWAALGMSTVSAAAFTFLAPAPDRGLVRNANECEVWAREIGRA